MFNFLGKKTKPIPQDIELFTKTKKKIILENASQYIHQYFEKDVELFNNFISIINNNENSQTLKSQEIVKNKNIDEDDLNIFFTKNMNNIINKTIIQKENLEKFLCEEQKEKIKDAVLIRFESNLFHLKIRDNDGSENIYFFFKEPTLVILIKGENEIEFHLFFDTNEFENFINSYNNSTVYYIQDNNLKSFYLKDKKNFIENKEKTTYLLLLDNINFTTEGLLFLIISSISKVEKSI